jgi:hemolysin activation/secretion protein
MRSFTTRAWLPSQPVGRDGLTLGAAVSHNTYALGDTFRALDAVGRSSTAELNLRYPWVRSVDFNVTPRWVTSTAS